MDEMQNMRVLIEHNRLVWAAALLLCVGCGPEQQLDKRRTTVSGKVALEGTSLMGGTVNFFSVEKQLGSAASIGKDGQFESDRVPKGENIVTVETESLLFGNPQAYVHIPAKYADPTKSGLRVNVQEGTNENVDFDLKK